MFDTDSITTPTSVDSALDLLSKLVTVRNGNITRGGVVHYDAQLENIEEENVQLVEELRKFVKRCRENDNSQIRRDYRTVW